MTDTDPDPAATAQIRDMIRKTMPAESKAFHAAQDAGMIDVPRDVFQQLFDEDGHDEAIRLCTHPERPYPGVYFACQPLNRMDAWERFLATHRAPRPGA